MEPYCTICLDVAMFLTRLSIMVTIMASTITSSLLVNDTKVQLDETNLPIIGGRNTSTFDLLSLSDIPQDEINLEMICKWFKIHPSNCSCPHSPIVCQAMSFNQGAKRNSSWTTVFIRRHSVTVIYATVALISSTFGIIGNAMVVLMAYRHRNKMSPAKLHVAELAVVNFIFSAVQVMNVSPLYWTSTWIYGEFLCKLTKSTLEVGSLLSSGFFQLITIERYFLIVRAANANMVKKTCEQYKHIAMLCNVVLVVFTVVPYIRGVGIEHQSNRCVNFADDNQSLALPYTWFTFIVYSVLPIGVTSMLAVKLLIYLSKERCSSSMVGREKVHAQILVNMLSVLTLFIVCTLPSRFVFIAMDMVEFKSHHVLLAFQFLSYMLYSLQGTLNPILYNMMAKEWRRNLSGMVQGFVAVLYHRANSAVHPL